MRRNAYHHEYFKALVGRWSSRFSFRVSDFRGFFGSSLSLLNKLQFMSLFVMGKLLGPPRIRTQVVCPDIDQDGTAVVQHTTIISKFGVPLYRARENFSLDRDGRSLRIGGQEWLSPLLWIARELPSGHGEICDKSKVATYSWAWFGESWIMKNSRSEAGVQVSIRCAWGGFSAQLRRV